MKRHLSSSAFVLACLLAGLSATTSQAQSPVVLNPPNLTGTLAGSLPGAVEVTPGGESTYSVPIPVPPGTNGIAPKLSLDYRSRSREGMLGFGWSIGGTSAIERCAKTVAQDATARPVQLDASDPFCIDGSRLILVSGSHGTNAVYRTEVDSFAYVESTGSNAAVGPTKWTVKTRDGAILTYGNTADSQVEAPGKTTIYKWALSRVEDRSGNYSTFTYTEDNAAGEHYLSRVRFTGNTAAALTPYNAIDFNYVSRTDTWQGYLMGSKLQILKRLSNVQVKINTASDGSGGTIKRQLNVGYQTSPSSGRSLISSVTDCDGGGVCLPATSFTWTTRNAAHNTFNATGSGNWGGPAITFKSPETTFGPKARQLESMALAMDFNGDGKADLAYSNGSGTWRMCLSTGTSFTCSNWTASGATDKVVTGDFDGNGMMDFAIPTAGVGVTTWTGCLSTGTAFSCGTTPAYSFTTNPNRYISGDFNYDGRDDLLALGDYELSQQSRLCLSNGGGFNSCTIYDTQAANLFAALTDDFNGSIRLERPVTDFNGDGRPDFLVYTANPAPGTFAAAIAGDTGYFGSASVPSIVTGITYPIGAHRYQDSNRDPITSYTDIHVGVQTSPGNWQAQTCHYSGSGLVCTTQNQTGTDLAQVYNIADYDGDGRLDIRVGNNVGQILPNGDRTLPVAWSTYAPGDGTLVVKADFDGDGVVDEAYYSEATTQWTVRLAGKGSHPDLLATVTNGLGHLTEVQYKGIYDTTVYTRDVPATYPQRDVFGSMVVVSLLRVDNAVAATPTGFLETAYRYWNLRTDLLGRGLLGFAKVSAENKATNVTTTTTYSQTFPTIGMPLTVTASHSSGTVLTSTTNTWSSIATAGGAAYPYIRQVVTTARDLNSALFGTTTTTVGASVGGTDGIDAYGNVTLLNESTVSGADTYTTATTSTFDNRVTDWLIGLRTAWSITKTAPSVANVTRNYTASYDTKGQLNGEITEPSNVTLRLETVYDRHPTYGVLNKRQLKWTDPATATAQTRDVETFGYDTRYRYATAITNAKTQQEQRTYDEATGNILTSIDPNSLTTSWQYDSWGRKTRETRPDQTATTWAYRNCVDTCDNFAKQVVVERRWAVVGGVDQQTTVPQETFTDRLGRIVLTRSWDYAGAATYRDAKFDAKAQLQTQSRWHTAAQRSGGQVGWRTYLRDDLGRSYSIKTTKDTGSGTDDTGITYNGWTITTVNAKAQSRVEVSNPQGKVVAVTDAYSKTTNYRYDAFGGLLRVTDPVGNQINVGYDTLGRKLSLSDPNLGNWTYQVNPLGLTWRQTDAKTQQTTFTYDALNRMTRRLEADLDSNWVYDTAIKGVGQLAEAFTGPTAAKTYQRLHTYDAMGRPSTVTYRQDWDYSTTTAYDNFSRPSQLTHARNTIGGSGGASIVLALTYNNQGLPYQVLRAGSPLWTNLSQEAYGRTTKEQFSSGLLTARSFNPYTARLASIATGTDNGVGGVTASHQSDGYTYDALGNVSGRTQLSATSGPVVTEAFGYDNLNRLTSSQVSGQALKSYTYDDIGNLKSKTSVGTYTYPAAGAARPHAASSITGTVAGLVNPTFTYDNNGNLSNGIGRAYGWSAGNMPTSIDRLVTGSAVERTEFAYGPGRERLKQAFRPMSGGTPGAVTHTLYYAGSIEKEIVVPANSTTIRTYLPFGLGFLQESFTGTSIAPSASATPAARFAHRDMLGSPLVMTDAAQAVLQRMSYDPWGRRRNNDGTDDSWALYGTIYNNYDHSGFTAQQQVDQIGLVHLNGRLYDPITSRMASADPMVPIDQEPQALNRYSYVVNSPGTLVDPTGFEPKMPGEQSVEVLEKKKLQVAPGGAGSHLAQNNPPGSRVIRVRTEVSFSRIQTTRAYVVPTATAIAVEQAAGVTAGTAMSVETVLAAIARVLGPAALAVTPTTLGDSSIYPLYRVVGPAELADIQTKGQFAFGYGQMEVKQFALSLPDAQYYRDEVIAKLSPAGQELAIVQTTVTGATFQQLLKMPLDFRMAVTADFRTLPLVNADSRVFGGIRRVD